MIKAEYDKQTEYEAINQFGIAKIQDVMKHELKNPAFHLSKETLKNLLEKSFQETWESASYDLQYRIINDCFENYDYNTHYNDYMRKKCKSCFCLKCCRTTNEFSSIDGSIVTVNSPLL